MRATNFYKMVGLVLVITFVFQSFLFSSEGRIFLPPEGDTLVFTPGTDVSIRWTFDDNISDGIFRTWTFTETKSTLAIIVNDSTPTSFPNSDLRFEIRKPATLILKNVNYKYNGTYEFKLQATKASTSLVTLFVAVRPNVTACNNTLTVNEDDNVTCQCKGEGGNPPANVTWYYGDNKQIGSVKKKENTLMLYNVKRTDNGTLKCVVSQSQSLKDERATNLFVLYPPDMPVFKNTSRIVNNGAKNFTITCESDGQPQPSFKIFHNVTLVSNTNTYIIDVVKYKVHSGSYKCVAENKLGESSSTFNLTVAVRPNVTVNCSSRITETEGASVTCLCKGEGGNPPATVIWSNDRGPIGEAGDEEQTLSYVNINRTAAGKYTCAAKSYNLQNNKSIEIIVHYPPAKPVLNTAKIEYVTVGTKKFTITCESGSLPSPSYKIYHSNTIVSNTSTYTIRDVKISDSGSYKCVAKNDVSNSSKAFTLLVGLAPTKPHFGDTPTEVDWNAKNFVIKCESSGLPSPTFKITHTDNNNGGSTTNTYTIDAVGWDDEGTYNCTATNIFGTNSSTFHLKVTFPWWIYLLAVLGSLALVAIIVVIVWYCIKKSKYCEKGKCGHKKKHYSQSFNEFRGNVSPSQNRLGEDPYDSIDRKSPPGGNDVGPLDPSANASTGQYDTVNFPTAASDEAPGGPKPIRINSTIGDPTSADDGAPGGAKPTDPSHVYASVDKSRNYASLDTMAMQVKNPKDTKAAVKTEYASIQFEHQSRVANEKL